MTWAYVGTICGAIIGLGTIFAVLVKAIVREELKALDKVFLRKDLADEKFRQIEEHFDYIRPKPRAHGAD